MLLFYCTSYKVLNSEVPEDVLKFALLVEGKHRV